MEKEVVLKTYIHRYEADIAKGLLDEKGIDNMISDEDVGGFRTGMIIGDTIKLIVNEKDLKKASETIKVDAHEYTSAYRYSQDVGSR